MAPINALSRVSSSGLRLRSEAQAESWLLGLIDYERRPPPRRAASSCFHLERFEALLGGLGRPQDGFLSVHIAGTSGKGSIASALASICAAAGLRTGLYTSPHLASFRERIRVDGRPISVPAFVQGIAELGPRFGAADGAGFRTVFEILTALAFQTFSRRKVDIALIETGLGGRLDCTTAVRPALCVISSLGFDHTAILGNTIRRIAREKAGIIKPATPVIVSPQPPETRAEAMAELRRVARRKRAPLIEAQRRVRARCARESLAGSLWEVEFAGQRLAVRWRAFGPAAGVNLKTVLAAVELLRAQGFDLPGAAVRRGLADWVWPGRLEVVSASRPAIVIDGAHNAISARALRQALDRVLPGRPIQWVVAMLADKDVAGVLKEFVSGRQGDSVAAFEPPSPRALPARELAKAALGLCGRVACRQTAEEAIGLALREASGRGAVVVTGSLYIVAPARAALRRLLRAGKRAAFGSLNA